jgi:hypothetical protein
VIVMKQVRTLILITTILVLVIAQAAEAVSNAAVLYLRVAAGARPAGMGEAFVSIADDATATYWNPAGLGNAPISGVLTTAVLPDRYGDITDVVTMKGAIRGVETWVIAGGRLLMFDGNSWSSGTEYPTSSDQILEDFLRTIIDIEDEEKLKSMAVGVIDANCAVTEAELDTFIGIVHTWVIEDYDARDDLIHGLEKLKEGYHACLLNTEHFRSLQDKLNDGLKDSVVTSEELDRLTYSLDRVVNRFLPSRLIVPHSTGIGADLTCLGKSGKYLWVGTDDGLYRRAGKAWARFSTDDVLPSNNILCMDNSGDYLMIGTDQGLVLYYHGSFTGFDYLPKEPVEQITFTTADNAYAVIGGVVHSYDGQRWIDSYDYEVRIDDNMEKLIARAGVYHTPEEHEYLERKITELNRPHSLEAAATASEETESTEERPPADSLVVDVEQIGAEEVVEPVSDTAAAPEVIEGEESKAVDESEQTEVEEVVEPVSDTAAVSKAIEGEEGEAVDEYEQAAAVDTEGVEIPEHGLDWLVEGNVIQLPYSPRLRYEVTAMTVDLYNNLRVGTTSGLLSFDGKTWTRYGYDRFMVPLGDSLNEAVAMTAEEIAHHYLPGADSSRIELLAANIEDYNRLNGEPVPPGETVYVYSSNVGASVRSTGEVFGNLYVGTEYGLEKMTESGWEEVSFEQLDQRQVLAAYDYDGKAYYVSSRGITTETSGTHELVLMHVKWLPNLDLDMYYEFLSYVHHVRGLGTFGVSVIYLTYGTIEFTDEHGNPTGEGHPFEVTATLSYGASLTSNLKWGMTGKFIHSHLSEQGAAKEVGEGIASAFALDMGILYKITERLQFGAALTNLGPDISYIDVAQKDPLPRNLGVGFSYKLVNSAYNRLTMQVEANKLLIDLDDEEKSLKEDAEYAIENAIRHIGMEYCYSNLISLRAGYKYDKEGQVKHLTFGAGLQLSAARLDFAYVPSSEDSPLANTLRMSLTLNL